MNKPIVGVLPLYDSVQRSFWIYPGYTEGITAAGGIAVVLSMITDPKEVEALVDRLDGFLFTGGQDVDPSCYKQPVLSYCREVFPPRDLMEKELLMAAIKKNKPIFGVCRGLQFFNAILGGSLYQDIEKEMIRDIALLHEQKSNFGTPIHELVLEKESRLYKIIKEEKIRVNSMHHQGIKKLSPQAVATAHSKDGLVEAIEIPKMDFGLAVQWHPEFLWKKDPSAFSLFKAFIDAARK